MSYLCCHTLSISDLLAYMYSGEPGSFPHSSPNWCVLLFFFLQSETSILKLTEQALTVVYFIYLVMVYLMMCKL
jgi:hypothetical protein